MEFIPNNYIVKLCLPGMAWKKQANPEKQTNYSFKPGTKQQTTLKHTLKVNDDTVSSGFPSLYLKIANCSEDFGDPGKANKNHELATSFKDKPSDKGSFYHGTKADMQVDDLLAAENKSNYRSELNNKYIVKTITKIIF